MVIYITNIVIALLLIVLGGSICSRKRIIISKAYLLCFNVVIIYSNLVLRDFDNGFDWSIWVLSFSLILLIIIYIFLKDIYVIYNVNEYGLIMLLDNILKEAGIDFERDENRIVFTGLDKAGIVCRSTLGEIEFDLRGIRGTKIYNEVKYKIKEAVEESEKGSFPYTGVFFILLGIIYFLIFCLHY